MSLQRLSWALQSMLEILDSPLKAKGNHLIDSENILKYLNFISATQDPTVGIKSVF